jgi:hypothetical protein
MSNRSTLNVILSVLAVSLLFGAASSSAHGGYTGSGESTYDDAAPPSYNGSTTNSAVVSWLPPTTRSDASALTDLAGYRIYYGKSLNAMTHIIDIQNPGQTSQFIDGLDQGTWYFVVTAYTSDGLESTMSELAAKKIL